MPDDGKTDAQVEAEFLARCQQEVDEGNARWDDD